MTDEYKIMIRHNTAMFMSMPRTFQWTLLQINHNTVPTPHRDLYNKKHSLLLLLGDFSAELMKPQTAQ